MTEMRYSGSSGEHSRDPSDDRSRHSGGGVSDARHYGDADSSRHYYESDRRASGGGGGGYDDRRNDYSSQRGGARSASDMTSSAVYGTGMASSSVRDDPATHDLYTVQKQAMAAMQDPYASSGGGGGYPKPAAAASIQQFHRQQERGGGGYASSGRGEGLLPSPPSAGGQNLMSYTTSQRGYDGYGGR